MPDNIKLDLYQEIERDFPDVEKYCVEATNKVLTHLAERNYDILAKHSPSLRGFQWSGYIELSLLRMVRVARVLKERGRPGQKVLDFGSYFGNFSLMAKAMGYDVDALDSYQGYQPVLDPERALLERSGVTILDSTGNHELLSGKKEQYDFAIFLGVIEHIPHTPRFVLEALYDALKPGGVLILDTPNLAYLYRREALMRGESIHAPIKDQYYTALPFEGHHREYCLDEVIWMLEQPGFKVLDSEMFNFSVYGLSEIVGNDLENYKKMREDESLKELIFMVAEKRASS